MSGGPEVDPNIQWAIILGLFLAVELWALAMRHDRLRPATYWLRRIPWVIRALIIVWLVQHFLLCGRAC